MCLKHKYIEANVPLFHKSPNFWIQSPQASEHLRGPNFTRITPSEGPETLAYEMVQELNGYVLTREKVEDDLSKYVDVIISAEPPYTDDPLSPGEQKFYYEPEVDQWYAVELPLEML